MEGQVVHYWKAEYWPGNSVYLLESGHLLRSVKPDNANGFAQGGAGGRL
ncbi:MAG: hypothetical protein ACI9OD_004014 [Limisphaerales bacterium]|jgi:hypothetical protein